MDVKLVLIPVTVTDPYGVPYAGLPKETFRLFEDGVEQKVTYFATEDAPVSLGIVFDASGSMQNKIQKSRQAVAEFFKTSVPGDEFFIVEFNDSPHLLHNFTTDTGELEKALESVRPKGWTSLLDAIYFSVNRMRYAKNPHKALLVISDGGDNASRYNEAEMRTMVREADVCIYSIGMLGPGLPKSWIRLLTSLSDETGGQFYPVERLRHMSDAVEKISRAIRNQYVLGYASTNQHNDGLYRKVEVKLAPTPDMPPARASWRVGYYAPLR
ncbi:MAG: VWA domain-containing protein [Acidobacteriota bacterium]